MRDWFEEKVLAGKRPYLWMALVIFLLYARAISFDFTHLDDTQLIVDNYAFISNPANILKAFQHNAFPNSGIPYYRPLLTLSFMLNAQLGGISPAVYHFTNIIIHIAVSCAIFFFFLMLWYKRLPAFLVSFFFAVHPALAQAVAWVPGRNDSMLALFALLSFIFLLLYLVSGKFTQYICHMLFFAMALFTKESAVVLLVLFVFYIAMRHKKLLYSKDILPLAGGWVALSAFWFTVRQAALINTFETPLFGMAMALFKSLPATIQFIGKIFFPFNLSVFPTIQDTTFAYGIAAIVLVLAALIFSKKKDIGLVFFGLSWFMLFLAFSFIRPMRECVLDFQEHRLYVPVIGVMIILLELDFIKNITVKSRKLLAAAGAVAALFCVLTFSHIPDFKDSMAFWSNASRTSPTSPFVHLSVGFAYYQNGLWDEAEEEYKKAIKLEPTLPMAHLKLGLVYLDKKMLDAAETEFKKEIACDPYAYYTYLCLGLIYYKEGKLSQAEGMWLKTLRADPENTDAMKNLAIFYYERKNIAKSIFYVEQLRRRGVNPPPEFLKALNLS